MENFGFIYIMTNPAFPTLIKIGYAKDVDDRLRSLNQSSAIPYSFRVYATYKVCSELSDKEIHRIIDSLNPDLRTKEEDGRKTRTREFFEMSPEKAYSILEAIAKINGLENNLEKRILTGEQKKQEKAVEKEIQEHVQRGEIFSFEKCHIPVGSELEYINDKQIKCKVFDDRKIEYNGKAMYLTGLAKILLNKKTGVCGPLYFNYKGKNLQRYYEEYQK